MSTGPQKLFFIEESGQQPDGKQRYTGQPYTHVGAAYEDGEGQRPAKFAEPATMARQQSAAAHDGFNAPVDHICFCHRLIRSKG